MNAPFDLTLDKAGFLRWAEGREGRYELQGGRVVMMTGGSKNHARIVQRFALALARQLDQSRWAVTTSDLAVEIGEAVRYPDLVLEPLDNRGRALSTTSPVLLIEVLSPSSLALDLNIKAREYLSLPSLEAYIVASQDEPRSWIWQRTSEASDRAFASEPEQVVAGGTITISVLNLSLPLAEIYQGLIRTGA